MQDAGGVRLEADHHRVCVLGLGSPHDLVDHVAVSAVHTVEVTDAEDRGTEVAGDVVELVESLHAAAFHRRAAEVAEKILLTYSLNPLLKGMAIPLRG